MEEALTPEQFRAVWEAKPVLRAVYHDYYRRMLQWCRPGITVEVGAGSGNLKDTIPQLIATDIVAAPWLDAVVDASALPFTNASVGTLVGIDILHHVQVPVRFLAEAQRVLEAGGRVVLLEPAITPVSRVVFRLGHPEPVDMGVDPLIESTSSRHKHPMDSNQALPTLLARAGHASRLRMRLPELALVHCEHLSLAAYPLSGGFRRWNLIPRQVVGPLLRLEDRLAPALGRLMGFRMLMVYERS